MNPISVTPGQPQEIRLWADGEIDTTGWNQPEEITFIHNGIMVIRNVSRPSVTAYLPDPAIATGAAVVICPGGAYHFLAFEHEGTDVASWLNAHGIAAFVLKYRTVQTGNDFPQCVDEHLRDQHFMAELVVPLFPAMAADASQALRLVREHAAEWNIAPQKIGIMGFSAGGMVTLSAAQHYDSDSRPNFAAPIYSAPPMGAPIPVDAPPLFLLCAADDDMASAVSTRLYSDWRSVGQSVELHIYSQGGHGFGMRKLGQPSDTWIERFAEWLQGLGLLSSAK
jgi:acetyl esterase/lipase